MCTALYEKTLKKYSCLLHPNHHIMIDLEFTLVQLYGRSYRQLIQNNNNKGTSDGTSTSEDKRYPNVCEDFRLSVIFDHINKLSDAC